MYAIRLLDSFPVETFVKLEKNNFEISATDTPDAVMVASSIVPDELVCANTLAIARAGVGVNTINVAAATENGTVVMNTPGVNANAVKELVLLSLLLLQRPIYSASKMVKHLAVENAVAASERDGEAGDKAVETSAPQNLQVLTEARRKPFVGQELLGKTVGVLGLGAIGTPVARICYELGMDVLAFARRDHELPYAKQVPLETILAKADFIIVVLPLSEQTRGLLNAEALRHVKPGACLLNFGRGEVVDNGAVIAALNSGQLKAYVTDFPHQDFAHQKNVMMLPHIGGSTKEALTGGAQDAVRALRNFLLYGTVRESVNYPTMRLTFEANYRFTLFYDNTSHAWAKIMGTFVKADLQIENTASNHREGRSYMLIDVQDTDEKMLRNVCAALAQFPFMKRARLLKQPN